MKNTFSADQLTIRSEGQHLYLDRMKRSAGDFDAGYMLTWNRRDDAASGEVADLLISEI